MKKVIAGILGGHCCRNGGRIYAVCYKRSAERA